MSSNVKIYKYHKPYKWVLTITVLIILILGCVFLYSKEDEVKDVFAHNNNHVQNIENSDWNLILVNEWNKIPEDYTLDLMNLSNGNMVDKRIYPELQQMFDDARSQGIYPTISSSYRNSSEQQKMMDDKIEAFINEGHSRKEAEKLAKSWVAEPGTSEHELGLALDINADKTKSDNDTVYSWLEKNSYKYGFIVRYPSEKAKITGVSHEPWHFRYVGKKAAKEIYEKGLCLEEYIKELKDKANES